MAGTARVDQLREALARGEAFTRMEACESIRHHGFHLSLGEQVHARSWPGALEQIRQDLRCLLKLLPAAHGDPGPPQIAPQLPPRPSDAVEFNLQIGPG